MRKLQVINHVTTNKKNCLQPMIFSRRSLTYFHAIFLETQILSNPIFNLCQIRRTTPKKLHEECLENGTINCYKDIPGHETCSSYKGWKSMHVVDASALKQEASSKAKSMYIALLQEVVVHGKVVQISGGIKSLKPPCKEEASSSGKHPYTCEDCFSQLRELQDILGHRRSGSLDGKANRLRLKEFNNAMQRKVKPLTHWKSKANDVEWLKLK